MAGEPHFGYFADYYGHDDYAHRWVEAAFEGEAAGLENGDADFSLYEMTGRLQAIKKGTAYMHVLMYAIHEAESAVGKCEAGSVDGNAAALHAWDEAVVSYKLSRVGLGCGLWGEGGAVLFSSPRGAGTLMG